MRRMLLAALLLSLYGSLVADIVQVPGRTINGHAYVAWHAADYTANVIGYPARRQWSDSNAARFDAGPAYGDGWYIIAGGGGDSLAEKNYVTYDIKFTVPGDYQLYQRIGAFNTTQESSCDTMWFNCKVSNFLVSGDINTTENRITDDHFEDENNLLWKQWQWFYIDNSGNSSTPPVVGNQIKVTQANLDAGGGVYTFTFMLGAREGGMAHDAMVAVAGATNFNDVSRENLHDLFMRYEQPWDASPASGSTGVSTTPTLSWKGQITEPNTPDVIDPSVKKFYVHMTNGTADPNLYYIGEVAVTGTSSAASFTITTALNYLTTYSWRIEEGLDNGSGGAKPTGDPNNIWGETWTFTTRPANLTPVISAGADRIAWLTAGTSTVQLAGQILQDDGQPVAATTTWSVVNEPNLLNPASIDVPSLLNATVTTHQTGNYTLRLTATDTEHVVTDDMVITVYADSCAAAKATPGFIPLVGDLDADCNVDIDDFVEMALNWLKNNAL